MQRIDAGMVDHQHGLFGVASQADLAALQGNRAAGNGRGVQRGAQVFAVGQAAQHGRRAGWRALAGRRFAGGFAADGHRLGEWVALQAAFLAAAEGGQTPAPAQHHDEHDQCRCQGARDQPLFAAQYLKEGQVGAGRDVELHGELDALLAQTKLINDLQLQHGRAALLVAFQRPGEAVEGFFQVFIHQHAVGVQAGGLQTARVAVAELDQRLNGRTGRLNLGFHLARWGRPAQLQRGGRRQEDGVGRLHLQREAARRAGQRLPVKLRLHGGGVRAAFGDARSPLRLVHLAQRGHRLLEVGQRLGTAEDEELPAALLGHGLQGRHQLGRALGRVGRRHQPDVHRDAQLAGARAQVGQRVQRAGQRQRRDVEQEALHQRRRIRVGGQVQRLRQADQRGLLPGQVGLEFLQGLRPFVRTAQADGLQPGVGSQAEIVVGAGRVGGQPAQQRALNRVKVRNP